MATEQFSNSASTTLNGAILFSDLSLVVASAASFPASGNFRISIENEILLVTGVAGTTFTVLRGQEGTTPQGHNHGVTVTHILTAGALNQLKADLRVFNGTGDPEGAVTADVGTLYIRLDGGVGTTLYVKETGSGNTGWAAK
jgi:hypothetical protein